VSANGEDLDAGAEVTIGRGEHRLALRYERTGNPEMRASLIRGHRLRRRLDPAARERRSGRRERLDPAAPSGSRAARVPLDRDRRAARSRSQRSWPGLAYALPWERRLPLPSARTRDRPRMDGFAPGLRGRAGGHELAADA
jgi:hypothetical protein